MTVKLAFLASFYLNCLIIPVISIVKVILFKQQSHDNEECLMTTKFYQKNCLTLKHRLNLTVAHNYSTVQGIIAEYNRETYNHKSLTYSPDNIMIYHLQLTLSPVASTKTLKLVKCEEVHWTKLPLFPICCMPSSENRPPWLLLLKKKTRWHFKKIIIVTLKNRKRRSEDWSRVDCLPAL